MFKLGRGGGGEGEKDVRDEVSSRSHNFRDSKVKSAEGE